MGLWLALYFPRLALESSLPTSTSAVPGLLLSSGNRAVLQCNDAALSCGIKPDMTVNTAYCLVPDVSTAVYDPAYERQALSQLALLSYRFSAHISVCHPDTLLLEIDSMLGLFGGLAAYHQQVIRLLAQTGYTYQLSTGHTPQTALVLAQSPRPIISADPQAHRQALMSLNIDQLGFTNKQAKRLQSMGIHQCHDLSALPKDALGYRFGAEFLQHWQAFEQVTHLGDRFQIPARFQQRIEFQTEVVYAKGLIFPLKRMMQTLEHYLHLRQLAAEHLVLILGHRKGPDTRLVIRAVQGAWHAKEWLELIAIRLDRLVLRAPVLSCRIRVLQFQQQQRVLTDLLGGQLEQFDGSQLLSLLVSRLGHHRVNTPTASADPRPEKSGQLVSALSRMTQDADQVVRPHPVLLSQQGKRVTLSSYAILCGPERVGSGWWDLDWKRYDYYGAQSNTGMLHWLERHVDGQWWQRGLYG